MMPVFLGKIWFRFRHALRTYKQCIAYGIAGQAVCTEETPFTSRITRSGRVAHVARDSAASGPLPDGHERQLGRHAIRQGGSCHPIGL